MKKKDCLLQFLKKEKESLLFDFLEPEDLFKMCLCSKKYYQQIYSTLVPIIQDFLESQRSDKKIKQKNSKKGNKVFISDKDEVAVQTEKISFQKFVKKFQMSQWKRIDKFNFENSYLKKKLETKAVIFYENQEDHSLMFINRSLVDPKLNYNSVQFDENQFQQKFYEQIYDSEFQQNDFSSRENMMKRQKQILDKIEIKKAEQKKNEAIDYNEQLCKAANFKKMGIILCFGGSFSFGIFKEGKCILHKSDKKYVCRKKAGGRQLNKDKHSGSNIQSMGSQIRRENQTKHISNVAEILKQNKKELAQCDIILLQAPGLNRLYVINEQQNLDGLQDKLRSLCLTAKKANFTQVEDMYDEMTQIRLIRKAEPKK